MKDDPIWLTLPMVLAFHEQMLARHGGSSGVRDQGLLESALGRARNAFAYGDSDLCSLAASYAMGIANNHPFVDGNNRTAFMSALVFLGLNGLDITASEAEVVVMTVGLADKSVDETGYARWLRDNTRPRKVSGPEGSS
jgi:death-on-curing protein